MSGSYDPPGWYVDSMEQQVPALIEHARKNGQDAVQIANLFLDKSVGDGTELSDQDHVEALALLTGLLVRRLTQTT